MKSSFRANPWVKAVAILLHIACWTATFFGVIYCGTHWDTFLDIGDYTYSTAYVQAMNQSYSTFRNMLEFRYRRNGQDGFLSYLEQKQLNEQTADLDPSVTNFRYIVRDNKTGEILLSSMGESSLDNVTDISSSSLEYPLYQGGTAEYDAENNQTRYYTTDGTLLGTAEGHNIPSLELAVEYGVDSTLPVNDAFLQAKNSFTKGNIDFLYWTIALAIAGVVLTVFLICCAGHRPQMEEIVLNWQDKLPYDLYLVVSGTGITVTFVCTIEILESALFYRGTVNPVYANTMYFVATMSLIVLFGLLTALIMTTAARIKTHTLLRNTWTGRLWRFFWGSVFRMGRSIRNWFGTIFGYWSLTRQVVVLFVFYLLGTLVSTLTLFLIPVYQGFVLFVLCRRVREWTKIQDATQAIVNGRPDTVIDLTGMKRFPDLAWHASQLNDLGKSINVAVEERMKSERMKAELITNVSHDLKTPLTSIINYVDLLKKEDISNEKAQEYIEVLDRKSQHLKKLTTDLVEASKASTGVLAVNAERLSMTQLINQALGEYSERFVKAGLTPVISVPEKDLYVIADGRHLWRILDNLLGNCVKYALAGTRIYLDVVSWEGTITLFLKNISAVQLNIPADQLMERFVRGDESRSTEGSGLGLSIARSLTELQHGTFRLEIDGDLFKVIVGFPEAA